MVLLHIFCKLVILLQIISRHQQIENYGIHARYVAIEQFTRLHKIHNVCAYSFFEFELSLITWSEDNIKRFSTEYACNTSNKFDFVLKTCTNK